MINTIHTLIGQLYSKYKIEPLSISLPIDKMQQWSDVTAKRLGINIDTFYPKISDLFWAVGNTQIVIGYALIARKFSKFPKGRKGSAYRDEDVPDLIGIAEIHFWYHANSAMECIYRCWERMGTILLAACYPGCDEKLYYDQLVHKLEHDPTFTTNVKLNVLKKHVKHWTKISGIRNKISHKESSPLKHFDITLELTGLASDEYWYIPKYNYSSKDLVICINNLRDDYARLMPAIIRMKEFIDNV